MDIKVHLKIGKKVNNELIFSKSPILKNFSQKKSQIGLVGLIDAKGIDVAQCIWL